MYQGQNSPQFGWGFPMKFSSPSGLQNPQNWENSPFLETLSPARLRSVRNVLFLNLPNLVFLFDFHSLFSSSVRLSEQSSFMTKLTFTNDRTPYFS